MSVAFTLSANNMHRYLHMPPFSPAYKLKASKGMNVVNLPLHRITFLEPTGVGDVATSAAKARISESIDLERSLQIGCSVEAEAGNKCGV